MSTIILGGNTSGTITLSPPAVAGTITATLPGSSGVVSASPRYRFRTSGNWGSYYGNASPYVVPADVGSFYVFVWGSTGGISATTYPGGVGGVGYAEKYYSSVASGTSYSFTLGGGGGSGSAGGTTTFDTISITSSGGVTSSTASSGGVATGGDFNANGGTGGAGLSTAAGGGGGPGSRAGNGGTGAAAVGSTAGGGGGTGGNNASGATGGIAATAKAAGALVLPFIASSQEYWFSGSNGSGTTGGFGAYPGNLNLDSTSSTMLTNNFSYYTIPYGIMGPDSRGIGWNTTSTSGSTGFLQICEILK